MIISVQLPPVPPPLHCNSGSGIDDLMNFFHSAFFFSEACRRQCHNTTYFSSFHKCFAFCCSIFSTCTVRQCAKQQTLLGHICQESVDFPDPAASPRIRNRERKFPISAVPHPVAPADPSIAVDIRHTNISKRHDS